MWTPNRRRLKKTAVPSQNLPIRAHDKKDLSRIQEAAARDARASARHCQGMLFHRLKHLCFFSAVKIHYSCCVIANIYYDMPQEALEGCGFDHNWVAQ